MLTLALLRHAKSSWDDPTQGDFDRPLDARGRDAAPLMGSWRPDTASRPRPSCAPPRRGRGRRWLLSCRNSPVPCRASATATTCIWHRLRICWRASSSTRPARRPWSWGTIPGLHILARSLAAGGRREDLGALHLKLPTAGLVVVRFEARAWSEIEFGRGDLAAFVSPRRLLSSRMA